MEKVIKLLPSQKKFVSHQDEQEYAFLAGIGTGKSFATALWILQRVLQHGESYLVASQTFTTTKTVQFKAITDALQLLGIPEGKGYSYNKSELIMTFPNGACIRGGSSQAPNAVTGATKFDGCWFDEAAIFDNDARRYMMGRCRGMKEDGTLIKPKFRYTGSPPLEGHTGWFKDFCQMHPELVVNASMEEAVGKTLAREYFENQIEIYGGVDNPVCQAQVFGKIIDDNIGCYVFNNNCFHETEIAPDGYASMGIDCAGSGRDYNVFYVVDNTHIIAHHKIQQADTFQMNSIAQTLISKYNVKQVSIDCTGGFGNGIADMLSLNSALEVYRVNFGQGSDDRDVNKSYANARCQLYFVLAEACRNGFYIDQEEQKDLVRQLKAQSYLINSSGKTQLLEKDAIKKIIGCSPDNSDALALAWYNRFRLTTPSEDNYRYGHHRLRMY